MLGDEDDGGRGADHGKAGKSGEHDRERLAALREPGLMRAPGDGRFEPEQTKVVAVGHLGRQPAQFRECGRIGLCQGVEHELDDIAFDRRQRAQSASLWTEIR